MKKTPADLMREATRLTLEGDAAGAAALFQAALTGQHSQSADTVNVVAENDSEHFTNDPKKVPGTPAPSFTKGVHSHQGADMEYELFVPGGPAREPVPLIVMLHGCNQSPQDFATGTRMNDIAEASGMLVLYPAQSSSANPNRCWNWFEPHNQARDNGEPGALSALTWHIMENQPVDPQRVFVAGFSAGGAMALILAEQYPELYCAVGVHSGLPSGGATSNMDAFRMMQGSFKDTAIETKLTNVSMIESSLPPRDIHTPLIVFHGSQDHVVNVSNAEQIITRWLAREKTRTHPVHWMPLSLPHDSAAGQHCIVTTYVADEQPGLTGCEYWQLNQTGHGWSGGSPSGSYTEQGGPDAATEMVRFFLDSTHLEKPLAP